MAMSKRRVWLSCRLAIMFIATLPLLLSTIPASAFNMSPQQYAALHGGVLYANYNRDNNTCSSGSATTPDDNDSQFAQHLFVGVNNSALASQILAKYNIGGIFLMKEGSTGRVGTDLRSSIKDLQSKAKTPLLVATDQEYADLVDSFGLADGKKATELATMSVTDVEKEGERIGDALAAAGVNMDFAPVVDIQNPDNDVIGNNFRGISDDPQVIATQARAFSDGLMQKKVSPVIKHFPGHGNSSGDSHQTLPTTPALADLEKSDLIPFKNMASNQAISIMVGHLNVPNLTNGKPASTSPEAYTYLRNNLGFKGLAITDELADMKGAGSESAGLRIANALNAGADMALFNVTDFATFESYYSEAKGATTNVDNSHILSQKKFFGMTIAEASSTAGANGATSNSCCAPTSSIQLSGKDNMEKILKYLLELKDKDGKTVFTLAQAAGILGNFHVESGFVPNIQQGESDPKNRHPGGGSWPKGGWGIAQWTQNPGRRGTMIKWLEDHNASQFYVDGTPELSPADNDTLLAVELDFFWNEMQNSEHASLVAVQATSDPSEAAAAYERTNERCSPTNGESGCSVQERKDFATNVYTQYADGAPLAGSATGSTNTSAGSSSGSCSSSTVGAGDFVFYTQWDRKSDWASIPYWGGTIATDGCEPTAVAEIVATWRDKKITPKETAAFIKGKDAEQPAQWYGMGSRLPEVFKNYGLTAKPIKSMDEAVEGLKKGGMVVLSARGTTPFTSAGHYIVLRGITADGQVLLGDPNSPAPGGDPEASRADYNSRPWDPATINAAANGSFNSMNLVTNEKPV